MVPLQNRSFAAAPGTAGAGAKSPPAPMRAALLGWYRRNRAALPWRDTSDPYRIWVSEVMLQQTRITTVLPHYQDFLKAFPTVESLSRSSRERVLEQWAGMGYYRRAENLHRAARTVVKKFGGKFPRDFHQARQLPGVGDYTARAILSIAYKKPLAVLDGNVARVLARFYRLQGDPAGAKFRRAATEHLEGLLSRREPGNFNQAMMELGQSVCLPRAPRCPRCPLCRLCSAYRAGDAEGFPSRRKKPPSRRLVLACLVLRSESTVFLVRGLPERLMQGLWNFPSAFGPNRASARAALQNWAKTALDGRSRLRGPTACLQHHITFRKISVEIYTATRNSSPPRANGRWIKLERIPRSAVSSLARKIADAYICFNGISARR